jgi:hypothetical protein
MPRAIQQEETVKPILATLVCLLFVGTTPAQEHRKSPSAGDASSASASEAKALEAKIRKEWQDFKNHDKQAFAAILADGFSELANDAEGISGKDEEISELDHFNLAHYELKDFKIKPIGRDSALMTYSAAYSGTYDNAPIQMKAIYGEVWTKTSGEWKVLWAQETKVK